MRTLRTIATKTATLTVILLLTCGLQPGRTEARGSAVLFREHQGTSGTDLEATIEKYQREIAGAPTDVRLRIALAELLLKTERFPEAIHTYREALNLQPDSQGLELGLAEAYRKVHNEEQARTVLRIARMQHPRSVGVLRALGNLEIDGQKYDAAIEWLKAAVNLAPADDDVRNVLATAYLKKNDSEAALQELNKILTRDPANGPARFLRAQIYVDAGENEIARVDAKKVHSASPEYLPGRVLYTKVLVRLKECERAIEILNPAENLGKLDGPGLFMLANAYQCAGREEAAERTRGEFQAASRAEHEMNEKRLQSLHLAEQANALALQNKLSEAQDLLHQALENNPQNAFAYSQQAKIYFSMKQPERARAAIAMALQLQPYQPDFLFVEGVLESSAGNLDAALAAFRSVTYINSKEADAYYEIGKIFMQKHDRAHALAAFRQAATLAPDDEEYKAALKTPSESQP